MASTKKTKTAPATKPAKEKPTKKEKPPKSFDTGGTKTTPSPTRITFYGFAAFVGALKGPTHCEWWPDDPNDLNWSPHRLIPTDLSKTPTAARNKQCSVTDIQCDDHRTDGGLTTIGPRFPQGSTVGAIWLSETYWRSLGDNQPLHPSTPDGHAYELTSIVYVDGPLLGRRFYGVHAKIVGREGRLTRVEIWHPGRSRVPHERPCNIAWLDLAQDAHPIDPGATQIGGEQEEGALFIEEVTAKRLDLRVPKIPWWMGGADLF